MTSGMPVEVLEKRAAEQREHLHHTVVGLRQTVHERLEIKRNVRNHWGPVAGVLAIAGLALGYAVAGIFTSD